MHILGRNEATVDAAEDDLCKSNPPTGQHPEPDKEALSRSSIKSAQKVSVPFMTCVPVFERYELPDLVHMEP